MKKTLSINGNLIETKMFRTLQAATNFKNKSVGRELVYFKAYEYYVSIN